MSRSLCQGIYAPKPIENLIIIKIEISSEEDAYEIFETTNARGVDLNVADLVKNLVFKNISIHDDKDFVKDIWTEIINDVQATSFEMKKLLRYFWISKYAFITEKKLFKAIKYEITDWDKFLDDLFSVSKHINLLLQGNEDDYKNLGLKHPEKIYKSISAIRFMNVSQCYVLFLSILRNYNDLGTDPYKVFELIEKFTFVYSAVCKLPGNKVERLYSRYAQRIEEIVRDEDKKKISGKIQSLFSELKTELTEEKPPFEYFNEQFQEIRYKNTETGRTFVKYILSEINNIEETEELKIDFTNVNIEHILPQKPDSDWGLSKVNIKPYVHLLGNLTLVGKKINSRIGNKPLNHKVKELEKSRLKITVDLVNYLKTNNLKWDNEQIYKRQKELAKIAYHKIWDF